MTLSEATKRRYIEEYGRMTQDAWFGTTDDYPVDSDGSMAFCMTTDAVMAPTPIDIRGLYTRKPVRPKCVWCGQRMDYEDLDCKHCGGYQDE